jgi:hypothetical protein
LFSFDERDEKRIGTRRYGTNTMKTGGKGEAFSGTGSFVYHIVVRDSRIFSNNSGIGPFGIFLNPFQKILLILEFLFLLS